MAKPKWRQILLSLTLFSNVTSKKGSRCHAPALCLSQWRGWVYATFHLWDKENHRSSCNGGIFRVFRAGGFDENNRRWRNFNYSNREVLDLPAGGRNKKENTEVFAVLPSWNDEKEERFLRQKVTVMTWKMVEKIWILSKNIFGESLTKCAPSGHEKTIINRKSREPFFKYGSLRLNDLSVGIGWCLWFFPFLPKLHFQFPFPFLLSLSLFPPLPFCSSSFPFPSPFDLSFALKSASSHLSH